MRQPSALSGSSDIRRVAALWFGLTGAPIAWAIHLGVGYVLVPIACTTGSSLLLPIFSLATMAISVFATVVAFWIWRETCDESDIETGALAWCGLHFLASVGLLLGVLFVLVIGVESLPILLQSPCDAAGRLGI